VASLPELVANITRVFAAGGFARVIGARMRGNSASSIYLLCAYGVVAVVGVAAIRILTELAAPAVFGEANLLLMSVQLAVTTVSQPFTTTQLRYHSAELEAGRGDGFTRAILSWNCLVSGGIGLAAVLGWIIMRPLHATHMGFAGVSGMAILFLASAIRSVGFGRLQAERRIYTYASLLCAEASMAAAGAAIGLHISPSVDGYMLGQAAGACGAALLGLAVRPQTSFRMLFGSQPAHDVLGKVKAYGMPFAPMGLLGWLANSADRYALGYLAGPAAVGQYVAPFAIASRMMFMLGGAMQDIFRGAMFEAANRGDKVRTRRIFWSWLAVRLVSIVLVIIGLWLFGGLIARLVLAPSYRAGATPILMWVATGYGVQGLVAVVENRLMSLERSAWLVMPLAVGGAANLAFSFALIPRFGAIGAAMATTFSFVVQGCFTTARLLKAERLDSL
jgi:O-antigen/teichoic acid export membrane protein